MNIPLLVTFSYRNQFQVSLKKDYVIFCEFPPEILLQLIAGFDRDLGICAQIDFSPNSLYEIGLRIQIRVLFWKTSF